MPQSHSPMRLERRSAPSARKPAQSSQALASQQFDAEYVIYRLEEAGRTLLALPHAGYSTKLRTSRHDVLQSAAEAYGWHTVDQRLRPAVPSAAHVTRMDEALDWIPRIPRDRYVLRRILGSRALISPVTERHIFTWRRLAALLGADHKAVQRWHAQAIDLLVASLNASETVSTAHSASQIAKSSAALSKSTTHSMA